MNLSAYEAFLSALQGKNERVVQIDHSKLTFLAQNFNGRAALIAMVELSPGQVVPDGRGFSVSTNRKGKDSFVRIVADQPGVNLVFLKLVDYILERTSDVRSPAEVAASLIGAIDDFQRFSGRRSGRMTENQIRGLVPELLLLLHFQNGVAARTWDVFHAWGGPFGAVHDFEFVQGNAVEVKSTHRPPSEIHIASPAQTRPLADGLDLVVLPLEKVAPGAVADVSFLDLVSQVGEIAEAYGGDVADLWSNVVEAFALDVEDEYYEQWRFACGDWLRFCVIDGFPTIDELDVPHGVIKLNYSLELKAIRAFSAPFIDLEVLP